MGHPGTPCCVPRRPTDICLPQAAAHRPVRIISGSSALCKADQPHLVPLTRRYFWITDSCPATVEAVTDRAPFEVLSLAQPIAAALQI